MKRLVLSFACFLVLAPAAAGKPLSGRLCVDGGDCRDHVCGQELSPAPGERPYTFTTAGGEVVLGALAAGQRTIACAASGVLELRIDARKLPARTDVRIVVSDEKERSWTVRRSGRQLESPVLFRLPPATYKLAVEAPHASAFRTSVTVTDSRRTLAAELKPLPILSGTVLDRDTRRGIGGVLISTDVDSETISDAEGRFVLEADPEKWPQTLSFHAGGYAEGTVTVPPARASASLDAIYLSRGGTIAVELQQDRPGDAVEIELQRRQNGGRTPGATVKTLPVPEKEANTVVRFEGVEPGDYMVLVKGDQKWERLGEPVTVESGLTAPLQLRISPFPLRVQTIREAHPFAKAYVEVRHRDMHWHAVLVTDDAGEATVDLWQGGRMTSTVHAPDIIPFLERRTIEEGEPAEWRIELPTREITGRVVDARTGDPVGGAGLSLSMRSGGSDGYHMVTRETAAADGTFRLPGPAYGQHVLKAAAQGYAPAELRYSFLEPEQSRAIVVKLEPASGITLTVQDSKGTPISGARVLEYRGLDRTGISVTDASGAARVMFPDSEVRDIFVVPRDGSLGVAQLRGDAKNATVRVPEGLSRLVVRMESEAREPIPNLGVVVRYNGRVLPLEVLDTLSKMQGARIRSDADGRIVFDHMPPGVYEFWPVASNAELRALAAGAGPAAPVKIAAAPGENVAVLTFAGQKKP